MNFYMTKMFEAFWTLILKHSKWKLKWSLTKKTFEKLKTHLQCFFTRIYWQLYLHLIKALTSLFYGPKFTNELEVPKAKCVFFTCKKQRIQINKKISRAWYTRLRAGKKCCVGKKTICRKTIFHKCWFSSKPERNIPADKRTKGMRDEL